MIDKKIYFHLAFSFVFAYFVSKAESSGNNSTSTEQVIISLHRDKVNLFGYANFAKHINASLNVAVALNGFVRRAGECAYICANSSIGFSFNYAVHADVHGRHVCEILSTDKYNDSSKFLSKTGFNHYSLYSPCNSFPCRNGAKCRPRYEQGTYECLCVPGFEGKFCQHESDECASNPCMNMGVCTDMFAAFKCTCHPGFSGIQCQIVAPGALLSGGYQVCSKIISYAFGYLVSYHVTHGQYYPYNCGLWGWWRCNGYRKVYGKAYRTAYKRSYRIGYSCCPGFRNPPNEGTCTINIDECASNPCQNGAACIDMVNGYQCNCTAGFDGSHCETNINECSSNPCANGGTCNDQVNGYSCACVPGYTGVQCSTDITDECLSNPCQNEGLCSDLLNGYKCTCTSAFEGVNCEIKR